MVPSLIRGLANRLKPAKAADATYPSMRVDGYGHQILNPYYDGLQASAEEGSFYVATNPTMGTAIVVSTSITAYAETAGAVGFGLIIRNAASAGDSAKRIIMSHIKLMIVQVPTSATSWQYVLMLNDNPLFYTSGGSDIVPVAVNPDVAARSSVAVVKFGALTTAVPGSDKRYVGRGTFRGVIPTTFDEMSIMFGRHGSGSMASAAASGRQTCFNAPVVIPPGYSLGLSMFGASNGAAPTFEFEIGWIER